MEQKELLEEIDNERFKELISFIERFKNSQEDAPEEFLAIRDKNIGDILA